MDENGPRIETNNIDSAIDCLTLTRSFIRDTDAVGKATIERLIPPDVAEEVKQASAEKKKLEAAAKAIEADVASSILLMIERGELTENRESKSGCKLALIGKDAVEMIDPALVPDEYLLPRAQCIDMAKVKESLEQDAIKAAAAQVLGQEVPASSVPGARLVKKYSLRTTAAEIIED